jgi:hypothetical protein
MGVFRSPYPELLRMYQFNVLSSFLEAFPEDMVELVDIVE